MEATCEISHRSKEWEASESGGFIQVTKLSSPKVTACKQFLNTCCKLPFVPRKTSGVLCAIVIFPWCTHSTEYTSYSPVGTRSLLTGNGTSYLSLLSCAWLWTQGLKENHKWKESPQWRQPPPQGHWGWGEGMGYVRVDTETQVLFSWPLAQTSLH